MIPPVFAVFLISAISARAGGVPVIDEQNYQVAKQTSETTDKILGTNKDILTTVKDTLTAVTGERSSVAGQMSNLAVGSGFSVASMPSLDSIISGGVPNFGSLGSDISGTVTKFINGLNLVQSIAKSGSNFAGDQSYQQLLKTVTSVAALVTGAEQAVTTRRSAFEQAGQKIGTATDIKGSIDQNTQLQIQSGLTMNELVGVMNGAVTSLQADNQRILTDISNTSKVLQYAK
ncbi:type IV secretion system protein [Allorhizobium ampelinum]|uniref:type IV secretion system protein n=1 Tax=Allorhizobium ampelinum TaxID=3025782 RepID=UPI001F3E4D8A|nr:type IV secretion system protein [Allorhizobium ampelinum]